MNGSAFATERDTVARSLRQELKDWEQSFAAAHQGRKAERKDIKQHPDIALKYKQYGRLRRPASKRPAPDNATPPKECSTTDPSPSHSPYKRPKHTHRTHLSASRSYHPTSSPLYLSPKALRTSIGPTPQKDGHVLGLFEQLSASSNSQTPFKRIAIYSVKTNVEATPSKCHQSNNRTDAENMHKTSQNGSNKKIVNDLLTPSKPRLTEFSTPLSPGRVSKLCFDDTPAFLRRYSQRADVSKENVVRDEGISWSPVAIRRLPKAAGRSLSALLRGLREMEEDALDEELNVLREVESERASRKHSDEPRNLVNECQRPDMPLGPDHGLESAEDGVGAFNDGERKNGKSLKAWKKKGQKRTTRRVLMKPNTAKWEPEPAWKIDEANGDEGDHLAEAQTIHADRSTDYGCHGCECEDIEGGRGAAAANDKKHVFGNGTTHVKDLAKRAKNKISVKAHANFRALKIKNKRSKMKKGSRLGRMQ